MCFVLVDLFFCLPLAGKMGLPDPKLTLEQHQHVSSRRVMAVASVIGISTGCILGLCPLLFVDSHRTELMSVFEDLDVGNKGYLTAADVAHAIRALHDHLPEESIQNLLKGLEVMDQDRIDFDKFVELMKLVAKNEK